DANGNGTLGAGEVSTVTANGGQYSFADLGPGSYRVRQVVLATWAQTTANPADVPARSGVNVSGLDFGDQQQQQTLARGQTATIGFWANRGQTLIKNFGKTDNCQTLANWLATSFSNLFGNLAC